MKRKIRISLLFTVAFASVWLFGAFANNAAVANDGACLPSHPTGLGDFDDFVNSATYFKQDPVTGSRCEEILGFDFEKRWYVAAIARESGHVISVQANGANIFSTSDCSLWGLYSWINFDLHNLQFVDETDPVTIALDPYCPSSSSPNCDRFRICQLTQDSNPLGYLSNPTQLLKGDLIVGFDDSSAEGDLDYDDLIVALRAVSTKANPRFLIEKGASQRGF